MKLSAFVKIYPLNGCYAYYHSLKMKPVYLSEFEHRALKNFQYGGLPRDTLEALIQNRILVEDESDIMETVRRHIPPPYISLAYFILTEQCNLACRYCFLGNASQDRKVSTYPMSEGIAEVALKYFAFQTQQDMEQFEDEKEIIFYGGEPLINFSTLKFVVLRAEEYMREGIISPNLRFSTVTNGLLLDENKINFFKEHKIAVSISLDGATEQDNAARLDKTGKNSFNAVLKKISLANELDFNVGLSVTITPNLLKNMEAFIELLQQTRIDSICFNILHSVNTFDVSSDYYARATDFIISFYEKTKHIPIYEDRFARKLNTFIHGGIYYSDCAATSGSQIVITPSGEVGICHGCLESREFFITDINSLADLRNNSTFIEWSRLSPIFQEECLNCEALGICGGGCPINAKNMTSHGTIHSVDRAFCIHSKIILNYLIEKLYNIMEKRLS